MGVRLGAAARRAAGRAVEVGVVPAAAAFEASGADRAASGAEEAASAAAVVAAEAHGGVPASDPTSPADAVRTRSAVAGATISGRRSVGRPRGTCSAAGARVGPAGLASADRNAAARDPSAAAALAPADRALARGRSSSRGSRVHRPGCEMPSRAANPVLLRGARGSIVPGDRPAPAAGSHGDARSTRPCQRDQALPRRRSRRARSSSPAGVRSRKPSPPAAPLGGSSSRPSDGRPSRRSCYTPPRCGSRSSRSRAAR